MSTQVQGIVRRFEELRDAEISDWSGVEMALTEGREGGELWEDPSVPYLQMFFVDVSRVDGARFRITTEQADDLWGLSIHESKDGSDREADWSGIYRESALSNLPKGRISSVEVATLDGLIERVTFFIGASKVQFLPGEVYEEGNAILRIGMQDESVLVQVDGAHPRQNKRMETNG